MIAKTENDKTALLIMVHGSPKAEANASMFAVVELIRKREMFPIIEVGFMECNEPSIPEAIVCCVAKGATSVIAVPYFLHVGTHVAEDLPSLLEEAQARHPDVEFNMGPYLGQSPEIADLLAVRAREALDRHRMVTA